MRYTFPRLDPDIGYVSSNLILPKSKINQVVIKAALTYPYGEVEVIDPDTNQLLRMEQGSLKLWDETEHHLVVPREFIPADRRPEFSFDFVELGRPECFPLETVDIEDRIQLRDDEQVQALDALRSHHSGTLNLACGKGKTVLALKLAAILKVPTLIVVNTSALIEQWLKAINQHLGVRSVGWIQGDRADWHGHPIVLAMVHTLSLRRNRWPAEFRWRFGLVIYDEGHHMSAPVFVQSADLIHGQRFSLTATPDRTDGLESIYQNHLGEVIHRNLRQDLIPRTDFHVLKWTMPDEDLPLVTDVTGSVHISKLRTYLGTLAWRNQIIYDCLLSDLEEGRNVLVLSHSVDHLETMYAQFSPMGAGLIIGNTPQGERMPTLAGCNPVFGTFQLAREGLDKPSLDTLYVTTPFSNSNDMQQSWGRIQRQFDGKMEPLVRVFEDTAFPRCERAGRQLRKYLKERDYPYRRVVTEILEET